MSSSIDIFSQVTFTDIHECYYCRKDVECQFTVSPVLKPDSNDIVGIYKVGWKSTKDFFCHKSINVPTDVNPETSFRASVIFKAADLPEDTCDFYQFCYVSHADQRAHGISSPFQFSADESAVDWELVDNEQLALLSETGTALSPPEPSVVVIPDGNESMLQVNESEMNSERFEVQIEDLKQELHVKNELLASVTLEKEHCEAELHSKTALETTVEELQKQCLDAAAKCQLLTGMLETSEAKLRSQEEKAIVVEQQLNDVIAEHDKCEAHLIELRRKFESDIDEVRRQKEDVDAEILWHRAALQEKETELKAAQESLMNESAVRVDLEEQLNAEKAKNVELEEEVKTYAALKQMLSSSGRLRMSGRPTIRKNEASNETEHQQPDDSRTCPMCSFRFADDEPHQVIQNHVLDHFWKFCPVCDKDFSPEDASFPQHVDDCIRR